MGNSAPVSSGYDMFSSLFETVWFEFSVFLVTFFIALVLKWAYPKEASKKHKEFCEPASKEASRRFRRQVEPVPANTLSNTAGANSTTPEKRRSSSGVSPSAVQLKTSTNSSDFPKDLVRGIVEICGSSLRGSVRAAQAAIDSYEEMKVAGVHDQLKDLNAQIRARSKYSIQDFYNTLLQCAIRVGKPDLVLTFLKDMKNFDIPRDRGVYESAMKLLAGKKCYQQALEVYSLMEKEGIEPSPVTCSCLISFAAEVGELDRAISFFEKLSAIERPSIRAFMTILRVFSKMHDWQRSVQAIDDMRNRGLTPDTLVYNIVLATCVQSEQIDRAEALLKEMLNQKPPVIDVVSFNTVIKGLAQKGEFNRAIGFLEEMTKKGVHPNIITFNTVMDSAVRCDKPAEAWRVLSLMKSAGFCPDKYSCSILVKGLHAGSRATEEQIRNCLGLIEAMTGSDNHQLIEGMFQSLLDASIGMGNLQLTKQILSRLGEAKIVPSPGTYNTLLKFLAGAGEFSACLQLWEDLLSTNSTNQVMISTFGLLVELFVTNGRVAQAFELYQSVQDRCIFTESGTSAFVAFIRALCKARRPNLATQAYETAKSEGASALKELDLNSYALLVKAQCEAGGLPAAVAVLNDAQQMGLKPDDAMVSPLLNTCFREAQVELGQKIFEDYVSAGGRPNQVMLCTMVKLYGRCQKLQMALSLVETVQVQFDLRPSVPTYTALLQACVRNKQVSQALKKFREISHPSCKVAVAPDATMYTTLISGCTQANMVGPGLELAEEALQKQFNVSDDVLQSLVAAGLKKKQLAASMKQFPKLAEKCKISIDSLA
jgi:pentatricopeptide repeat protein